MPKTIAELKAEALLPAPCPLCERPNLRPSDHHLVPKSRGGRIVKTLCRDCHNAIHAFFTNKELEKAFCTVEALMGHEGLVRQVRFIARQDPARKTTIEQTSSRRRRNKYA